MQFDPRSAWGAVPPQGSLSHWSGGQPTGIAVHYVGGPGHMNLSDHSRCLAAVKNIQAYALRGGNGWTYSDIEYNLMVCPHGHVIEGRGLDWQGAAQKGANTTHLSVCALANVDDVVNDGMATAFNDAFALAEAHFGRDLPVVGHRDTAGNPTGTNCPGDTIEAWLHSPHPAPPTPLPEEEDVSSSFSYGGFLHRMWVSAVDMPGRNVKKGDLMHLYGPPTAAKPQGSIENMRTAWTGGLGPQRTDVEPEFKVNPDGTIDGTTIDASGAIVSWHWTGAKWLCVPYFPAP